jgi:putative spermidine/putrescine transport system substrate-binding protein
MSFAVNTDLVSERADRLADLLKPEYAGQVALAGDPRASNQAILGVLAAGHGARRRAGRRRGEAGLEFFKPS